MRLGLSIDTHDVQVALSTLQLKHTASPEVPKVLSLLALLAQKYKY
jgi:hypothetical protein